jgi:Nitrate/nitrite transporter
MDKNNEAKLSYYRWIILAMIFLTSFIITYAQFQVSALAYKIMPELNLSSGQMASIMLAAMLPGVFLAIISGMLADRWGAKLVVSIGYIISIFGAFYRCWANSYWTLFVSMICIGFAAVMLNSNAAKMASSWFPRRQVGIVMGLYMSSASLGTALSQATTPLFSSTGRAYVFAGGMILLSGLLWVVLVRNAPEGTIPQPTMPVTAYLGNVAGNRNIWVVSLGLMFFMGAQMSYAGFLPTGLISVYGSSPARAGLMASLFTIGSLLGSIIIPLLSDRLGLIKPIVISAALMGAIVMYGGWVYQGSMSWSLLILGGFLLGACAPLLMAFPALLPDVGPMYAGSAGGIISTMQMLGAFFIPSMIIAPLAGSSFKIIFSLACLCCALIGLVTIFLPELGHRKQIGQTYDRSSEIDA